MEPSTNLGRESDPMQRPGYLRFEKIMKCMENARMKSFDTDHNVTHPQRGVIIVRNKLLENSTFGFTTLEKQDLGSINGLGRPEGKISEQALDSLLESIDEADTLGFSEVVVGRSESSE